MKGGDHVAPLPKSGLLVKSNDYYNKENCASTLAYDLTLNETVNKN